MKPNRRKDPRDMPVAQRRMILFVSNTAFFLILYYMIPLLGFRYMPIIYLMGGAGLALWFVIYNRGFRTKGKTAEMLPEEYTLAEREEMIAEDAKRFEASRWALLVILPLLIVFIIDILYLFFIPEGLFS